MGEEHLEFDQVTAWMRIVAVVHGYKKYDSLLGSTKNWS